MENVILNKTPKMTSKSFGINDIEIKDFEKQKIGKFTNVKISGNVKPENKNVFFDPKFSIGTNLVDELNNGNQNIYLNIKEEIKEPIFIEFTLDKEQNVLVDNLYINATKNTCASIIVKYRTANDEIKAYHNGVCQVNAEEGANLTVTILNLLNENSQNYYL